MKGDAPLGLLDSGVGGLTVFKEVCSQLPREAVLYFADTGRVPYGHRSQEEIREFTLQILRFLVGQGVKMVIIACNTATAAGLEAAREEFDLPILGVIEPGAKIAARTTTNKRVGVLGTEFTINSRAYQEKIRAFDPSIEIFGQACPRFTPLIEGGKKDSEEIREAAKGYLSELSPRGIDTLVLGCTHYPLLTEMLQELVDTRVKLVNPAVETVNRAREVLAETGVLAQGKEPRHQFFVSGDVEQFRILGELILGMPLKNIKKVSF